jgi:periplasmic protein TonB
VTILTVNPYEPEHGREFTLWTSAALVVCALHIGLAAAYLLLKPEPEALAEAPVIDVAFMPEMQTPAPAVPETQQSDQPSADPPTDAPPPPQAVVREPDPPPTKEETTVQPKPEPPPPAQVEATVQPEPPPPPLALSTPEVPAETKVPEQVAVLPPPTAKPEEVAPPPEKPLTPPPEPTSRKPPHEEKVQKESRKPPPPKTVPSPATKPARLASAANPGQESEGADTGRASWLSEFVAHMRRFNTYSAGGSKESGTVRISVTIDRNGRLLSHRVVGSSGSSTLDQAALDIVQRAQPFPRFPAGMSQAQMVEVIPLHLRPQ